MCIICYLKFNCGAQVLTLTWINLQDDSYKQAEGDTWREIQQRSLQITSELWNCMQFVFSFSTYLQGKMFLNGFILALYAREKRLSKKYIYKNAKQILKWELRVWGPGLGPPNNGQAPLGKPPPCVSVWSPFILFPKSYSMLKF